MRVSRNRILQKHNALIVSRGFTFLPVMLTTATMSIQQDLSVDAAGPEKGAVAESDPPAKFHASLPTALRAALGARHVVLVGLMASGKTSVGRALAQKLGLPFADADQEIETAARMTIPEIFARHGEPYFRNGERRVIARMLGGPPQVLSTGGGAFMDVETRRAIAETGVSVWLKADLETLMRRVKRRSNRPLLQTADPEATMRDLIEIRSPVYATADVTVVSHDCTHEAMADLVVTALLDHLAKEAAA